MKKKSTTSQSGFFGPRVLVAILLCMGIACSMVTATLSTTGGKLSFLRRETPAKTSQRTLGFAERVSYQRAIEDVYWRHRIWPKERPDAKPSLDAVMTQAQLEKKVTDYVRNSQALEDYWHRPITADQLQAEMDRMAHRTKQPEVLRELFEALGNDPYVIAECLARPLLSERLITNFYAHDQRFHGDLKRHAEADLQTHQSGEQLKQTSGTYSEIELIRSDSAQDEQNGGAEAGLKLNSREWDQNLQTLAATFNKASIAELAEFGVRRHVAAFKSADMSAHSQNAAAEAYETIPTGRLSSLQEDEGRYYATAVVNHTKQRLKVATIEWPKEPLESWRARTENPVLKVMAATTANYTLPTISDSDALNGCTDDTWTATNHPPIGRSNHTAVWTGSEMIVWGGSESNSTGGNLKTGGRYNPSTDSWTTTSTTNAPSARRWHTAVWTGSEMIVWGGYNDNAPYLNTGGRYNPSTNSWTATSSTNAPSPRIYHTAVWTGSQMIVWGGYGGLGGLNTGGRYNPSTDTWTATSTTNAPSGRQWHTAVWTGSEMIVWSGTNSFGYTNSGGKYNPGTNSWTATSTTNAPSARRLHAAVWTGNEMIVWGGDDSSGYTNTGGRYNPGTNSWTPTSITNAPSARDSHTAVWTGSEMIVWGGSLGGYNQFNTGGRYNPGTDSWIATSTTNAPSARDSHTAVWTGNEMIVWGGSYSDTGGRYDPSTDTWAITSNAPPGRTNHTAVWTGSEMIVWGGYDYSGYLNTGERYNASTDSWTATTTTNAPAARYKHSAVWTGSEMIVWGGLNGDYVTTGGKYNPDTDSWIATSTSNAPSAREAQTAVWTGNEMIVWGGSYFDGSNHFYLNTGGKYNPGMDSWTATSTTNVPSGRTDHTAVWSGSEMIVWGGNDGDSYLNTGGRYNPSMDSWTATSTNNAASGRDSHTAVWTDSEMIIWGGHNLSGQLNTGGRYNPGNNSWTATSTANAPSPRTSHTAVWTGSEMIAWGGYGDYHGFPTNTGGRYNPSTDSWRATSTANAPSPRASHTAVWTGSEMIVWGGDYVGDIFSTGGRYCAQPPSVLGNISTRAFVQTGDNVMIGGFIVQGSQTKRVIIRAIGPELTQYGIPNPLYNPTLELHDGTGALIASNDNWVTTIIGGIISSNQVAEIRASGHAPGDGRESAIIADLPPGNYTAIVRGVDNMIGVALVEVYDLSPDPASILGNVSTRAFVQTGDDVMIGGFIVQGPQAKRVIIRAIGPELSAPPFNIPNALANPTLELHDHTGALIGSNDNWQHTIIGGIITTNQYHDIVNSGHAPSDPRESAIIAELPVGNYTAIVRGVNNTTGVALVEVYDLQ